MENDESKVSSEIYEENDYSCTSTSTFGPGYVVSKFDFKLPVTVKAKQDEDGDYVVPRKGEKTSLWSYVEVEHLKSTIIKMVGLQVWRGALLLADWLIHINESIPKGSCILELGSGVGLTSIIAAMYNPVFCTDIDKGNILNVIKSNVNRNRHIVKYPIKTLELDFMSSKVPQEIEKILANVSVIIAADTIYDDDITEAFVRMVELLLSKSQNSTLYVALEKRFVFTIAECDTVAPCYDYFLECLKKRKHLHYEAIALDFPQYFKYERVKELVLWKIKIN